MKTAVHFVGFRGQEYTAATKVWGKPDFIHPNWDKRAQEDVAPGDTVIFAAGTNTTTTTCNKKMSPS